MNLVNFFHQQSPIVSRTDKGKSITSNGFPLGSRSNCCRSNVDQNSDGQNPNLNPKVVLIYDTFFSDFAKRSINKICRKNQ